VTRFTRTSVACVSSEIRSVAEELPPFTKRLNVAGSLRSEATSDPPRTGRPAAGFALSRWRPPQPTSASATTHKTIRELTGQFLGRCNGGENVDFSLEAQRCYPNPQTVAIIVVHLVRS
jgi:hypothetical protein